MSAPHSHGNGIAAPSARELVALTVVIYRWQRDYLLALAGEQRCSPSTLLRPLLDQALGPGPDVAALAENGGRSADEPDEPVTGRSIELQPRHREVLAAVAERRALSLSTLFGAILDAWIEAHLDAGD